MAETRKCRWSGQMFEVTDEDGAFYKRIGVPFPTLCPEERERRRLIWRNERHLYRRECGLCRKSIIAIYPEECKFPVYCEKCYWVDKWDPLKYGREFNFDRTFFEQFKELLDTVPRLAITHTLCVNSDYTLNCIHNKNCYYTSGADYNEDCLYSINSQRSKNSVDHCLIYDSELCYGCLDSSRIFNCIGCQECENCTDSWFLYDCKGCSDCAFSSNLRHKKYVFGNQQLSKEDYEKSLARALKTLFDDIDWMDRNRKVIREQAIHRFANIINCENVSGNYIKNSKNAIQVFDAENLEDCKYVYYGIDLKDVYDNSAMGFECRGLYEMMSGMFSYNVAFSNAVFNTHDAEYCVATFNNAHDLFGCVSMKDHQEYVILNKKYSAGEYKILRERIIEKMKIDQEYGEFFSPELAPYEYNRSAATDHMPLSREGAIERGMRWYDGEEKQARGATYESPKEILVCKNCNQNYKIILQELSFYQKLNVPAPQFCWPCRLKKLIASRPPRKLFADQCSKCDMKIETPIKPALVDNVLCEKCYQKDVY